MGKGVTLTIEIIEILCASDKDYEELQKKKLCFYVVKNTIKWIKKISFSNFQLQTSNF